VRSLGLESSFYLTTGTFNLVVKDRIHNPPERRVFDFRLADQRSACPRNLMSPVPLGTRDEPFKYTAIVPRVSILIRCLFRSRLFRLRKGLQRLPALKLSRATCAQRTAGRTTKSLKDQFRFSLKPFRNLVPEYCPQVPPWGKLVANQFDVRATCLAALFFAWSFVASPATAGATSSISLSFITAGPGLRKCRNQECLLIWGCTKDGAFAESKSK